MYTHVYTIAYMRKKQVINITLSDELLKAVDKQAEIEMRNRSELMREAARMYLFSKNADSMHQNFSVDESSRLSDIKNFSDFNEYTTLAISCTYRPQPNKINEIFAGHDSKLIRFIEDPKSFRHMGWDLKTLGRAKPVAGEYLQITNGDRKIIRVFRDGQVIFSASEDFFGYGMKTPGSEINKVFKFNSMAVAELISNFVIFTLEIAKHLEIEVKAILYKVQIYNPKRKTLELASINMFREKVGELKMDFVDREVFISLENMSAEKIAYLIWAEINYLFGVSEDRFQYVDKSDQSMRFEEFIKKQ